MALSLLNSVDLQVGPACLKIQIQLCKVAFFCNTNNNTILNLTQSSKYIPTRCNEEKKIIEKSEIKISILA